jgi:hypothetical protein
MAIPANAGRAPEKVAAKRRKACSGRLAYHVLYARVQAA